MVPYVAASSAVIVIVATSADVTGATAWPIIPIAPIAAGLEELTLEREPPTFSTTRTRDRVRPRRQAAGLHFGKRRIAAWRPRL